MTSQALGYVTRISSLIYLCQALTRDPLACPNRNSTRSQDDSLGYQSPALVRNKAVAQPTRDGATRGPRVKTAVTAQPPAISRGICACIAQWLWPAGGWGPSCESTGLGSAQCVGPGTSSRQSASASASRPQLHIQPAASASLDCKACREWNVVCDHARPQCEHCYEQQILCFYVSPSQNPKRKARRRAENIAGDGEVAGISEGRAHPISDVQATRIG
jgi:hypothetical protein